MSTTLLHSDTGLTITLPNPNLGDTETFGFGNVNGTNRRGEVLNNPDADQPALTTLDWVIRKLTKAQVDELDTFLKTTGGDLVQVTDYKGNVFNAIMSSEEPSFTTLRDLCNYEVTLQYTVVA